MIEIMKASAGSGKTYSLALKYISLLLESKDRYAYRHILAVTFTNKATDEMKDRILKELHLLSLRPSESGYHDRFVPSVFPSDEELRKKAEEVLHDILHDYSAFAVSTIDRFFQQTLKAFSREIGQFASYQVELDKESLVRESVDRILDSLTAEDDALLSWLTDNVLEQIESGGRYSLDANLMDMAKRLMSPQRQEVMDAAGVKAEDFSHAKLLEVRARCREVMTAYRSAVREKAEEALSIITGAGVDVKESRNSFFRYLYDYVELGDNDAVPYPSDSFLKNSRDPDLWFSKAKAKTCLPKVYPFLEAPLNELCDLFGKEYEVFNTACILDRQLYGLGVAVELETTFKELMKEKNVLCIDDSNTILKNIIDGADAPFIYEKTGVRYDHYLLDEFQDTAKVQWQNFSPLLKESESRNGQNLIVGDVKQSIYRWRGSDWKLLQDIIPSEFPSRKETLLDTNYRSLSGIVDFNNAFFKDAASVLDMISGHQDGSGPVSEIYDDVRQKAHKSGRVPGNVSLTYCEKSDELQKVLDSVMEAQASGALLSEIAVLVRSNRTGEQVASYLMENGVPVVTDDSLRTKSSITVRRLVSLMSLVENPSDTVNGYLADALEVDMDEEYGSLIDMAESLLRNLKETDDDMVWKGEIPHIQSFMDHLQDFVNSEGNSLRGFLKFWDEKDPSVSSPSSGESVRVMTIHKSKGLAFPYVIIPFAENIKLYKEDSHWCVPEMRGTSLENCAEGVYDVCLDAGSEKSLFADDYREERFLQQVDNMNTAYVAMTRPVLGVHVIAKTPPKTCIAAVDADDVSSLKDFSQILYRFACRSGYAGHFVRTDDEGCVRFDSGEMVDFAEYRRGNGHEVKDFVICEGNEYPSIPLNVCMSEDGTDVRERGRLKFSADSIDFFSEEGETGISASNRIRGVVLHDILSRMKTPDNLEAEVRASLISGDLTVSEHDDILAFLRARLGSAVSRGWFPEDPEMVLVEESVIDTDGEILRPDRVVIKDGKVLIIDYKFGERDRRYERQIRKYMSVWCRMGYADVTGILWYVNDDEVVTLR